MTNAGRHLNKGERKKKPKVRLKAARVELKSVNKDGTDSCGHKKMLRSGERRNAEVLELRGREAEKKHLWGRGVGRYEQRGQQRTSCGDCCASRLVFLFDIWTICSLILMPSLPLWGGYLKSVSSGLGRRSRQPRAFVLCR